MNTFITILFVGVVVFLGYKVFSKKKTTSTKPPVSGGGGGSYGGGDGDTGDSNRKLLK